MTIQEEKKLLEQEIKKDRRGQSLWGSTEDLKWIHSRLDVLKKAQIENAIS